MIYIKLIDHFWELDESWQFTGTETRLYFYLLKISYSQGWECCMRSDAKISSDIGVSAKIFKSARGRLVEADLIEYLQGNGRGNKSGYLIKGIPKGRQNLPTFSQKGVPKGRQILPTFIEKKGMQKLPTFIDGEDCSSSDYESNNVDKGIPKGRQNLPTFSQKGVPKGRQILPTFIEKKGMQKLPTFIDGEDCSSSDYESNNVDKGIPKGRQNLPTFSQNSDSTKENKEISPTPPKENKENTTTHYKEKEKIIKKEKEAAGGDSMGNLFPSTETTANRGRVKPKIEPPSYDEVLLYFQERIENQDDAKNMAFRFYEHFRSLGWRTSSGGKIEYWDSKANLWIIDHYDYDRRRTETIRANPKTESGTHKESTQHSQGVGNDTGASKDYNQTF